MGKRAEFLTEEDVEKEIARLAATYEVQLARRELRLKYKHIHQLCTLRDLEKRGKELKEAGITLENIDEMMQLAEGGEIL